MFGKMMNYKDYLKNQELIEELNELHGVSDKLKKAIHHAESRTDIESSVIYETSNVNRISMRLHKKAYISGLKAMLESINGEIAEKERRFV